MTERDIEKVVSDIKALRIQGNTNVAKTIAKTILEYVTHTKARNFPEFIQKIKYYGHQLSHIRANEPMSINAVSFITRDLEDCENQQQVRIKVIERIQTFFKYIDESYEVIRTNGYNILKKYSVFYSHCHSSLARDVFIRLASTNPNLIIINDETRPLLQGRTTALELSKENIKVIHTLDSAVASIFLDPQYIKPEAVVVGCDGITINGDLVNKVGTYNIALAARSAGIPMYSVSQTMKLDMRSLDRTMEIEQRDKNEVWKERPKNIEIINPSFDLVPAKFITGGYITEKGLLKPEDFRQMSGMM